MNQKGFVNILLIVLAIILAGLIGYFALVKKPVSITPDQTPVTTTIPQRPEVSVCPQDMTEYAYTPAGFSFCYPDNKSNTGLTFETDPLNVGGGKIFSDLNPLYLVYQIFFNTAAQIDCTQQYLLSLPDSQQMINNNGIPFFYQGIRLGADDLYINQYVATFILKSPYQGGPCLSFISLEMPNNPDQINETEFFNIINTVNIF